MSRLDFITKKKISKQQRVEEGKGRNERRKEEKKDRHKKKEDFLT